MCKTRTPSWIIALRMAALAVGAVSLWGVSARAQDMQFGLDETRRPAAACACATGCTPG